jgi:cytochrome P450
VCLTDRTRAEHAAQRRLSTDPDYEVRKDFFHYLFHAQDPETGRGFSTEELWGEAESLIIAGSDTTAIAFTAMFFYLARKPDVQVSACQHVLLSAHKDGHWTHFTFLKARLY